MSELSPANYGPGGDQPIPSTEHYIALEQLPGHTMTIEFEVPAWNEFAIDGYHESAVTGPNAERYYERGNKDRTQEPWSSSAQGLVRSVITGWFKDGEPFWQKPWSAAKCRLENSDVSWEGNIRTLTQVVTFEDIPGAGYGAARARVVTVGPLP